MKQCPTCQRSYPDDSLNFCLDDGAVLISSPDPEATLVMPSQSPQPLSTLTAPVQRIPTSPAAASAVPAPTIRRTNPAIYIVIALLALIVGGGLVALLKSNAGNAPSNVGSAQPDNGKRSAQSEPSIPSKTTSTETHAQTKTLTVSAQRIWTDTGIDANAGDLFEITASGRANASGVPTDGAYKWVGPDGWGYEPQFTNQWVYVLGHNSSLMCLTGKVGSNGTPFKVGSNYTFTADHSGRFYLGVNDAISDYRGNVIYSGIHLRVHLLVPSEYRSRAELIRRRSTRVIPRRLPSLLAAQT